MESAKSFDDFILTNGIIGFKDALITYKSGRQGRCYVNWRVAINDTYLLDKTTDYILDFAEKHDIRPGSFYGVPEGATKLGVLTQFKWAKNRPDYGPGTHVLTMGRAKPKDHGMPEDKFFVGTPISPVVVLEDTTTTGGSLIRTIKDLQGAGMKVCAAIALTNRNELRDDGLTVPQALKEMGVEYYAMSNLKDLLPAAYKLLQPSEEVRQAVETYFEKYGAKD